MSTTTSADLQDAGTEGAPSQVPGRSGQRRRWMAIGLVAAAVVACTAGLVVASPLLDVRQVEVSGNSGISADEVISASGVTPGTSMLRIDTAAAADRVAELDSIASAAVDRRWPNTVMIAVVSDSAVAYSASGDQWDVWGAGGGRLSVVAEAPADLPALQDVPEASRSEALAVAGSLPADVRARVAGVSFQEGRGYLLELKEGAGTIRWGDAEQSELKSTVLAAMIAAAPDARWFDVSSPTAPRSAVAEPARVARKGATPSPSPSGSADDPATEPDQTASDTAGDTAGTTDTTEDTTTPAPEPGGESPLGLQSR